MKPDPDKNHLPTELETKGGKKFGIFKVANSSLYRIAFTSGGQVPEDLNGMWTDPYKAQRAIQAYLMKLDNEEKEKKTNKADK